MKKLFICAATLAVALSSCSKDEQVGPNVGATNLDGIHISGTTTRADINNITDVEAGFQIFGKAEGADVWYVDPKAKGVTINGTFDYYKPATLGAGSNYLGWQWRKADGSGSIEAPTWPSPWVNMDFYAAYPVQDGLDSPTITGGVAEIEMAHTIAADRFAQEDHLSAYAKATVRPYGGLTLSFNHILSKVNVSVEPGTDSEVEVQSIKFHTLANTGTYDYVGRGAMTGVSGAASYEYRRTAFAGSATAGGATANFMTPHFVTDTPETSKDAIHSNNATDPNGHLMLIPQLPKQNTMADNGGSLVKAGATGVTMNGAYIEVLYRVEKVSDNSDLRGKQDLTQGLYWVDADADNVVDTGEMVNYAAAVTAAAWSGTSPDFVYPGFDAPTAPSVAGDYVNSGIAAADQKLYIRAFFPINPDKDADGTDHTATAWAAGSGYKYNLLIAGEGAGGYYADSKYYDEAGNDTGLRHPGNIGDPVFDNLIHFEITVSDWGGDNEVNLPL